MREPENISEVVAAHPDFIGFIFYPKSSRFVGRDFSIEMSVRIAPSIKKVGVYVDEVLEKIIETSQAYHLEIAQLHGNESPRFCRQLKESGIMVFKAFSLDESFDFKKLEAYSDHCDVFLFDTKGQLPGGTGTKFDWQLLNKYKMDVPFFLSGGIKPADLEAIKDLRHPQLLGVDINSGFEIRPALKDINQVKQFIEGIRSNH